jgi:hypothetical protein
MSAPELCAWMARLGRGRERRRTIQKFKEEVKEH